MLWCLCAIFSPCTSASGLSLGSRQPPFTLTPRSLATPRHLLPGRDRVGDEVAALAQALGTAARRQDAGALLPRRLSRRPTLAGTVWPRASPTATRLRRRAGPTTSRRRAGRAPADANSSDIRTTRSSSARSPPSRVRRQPQNHAGGARLGRVRGVRDDRRRRELLRARGHVRHRPHHAEIAAEAVVGGHRLVPVVARARLRRVAGAADRRHAGRRRDARRVSVAARRPVSARRQGRHPAAVARGPFAWMCCPYLHIWRDILLDLRGTKKTQIFPPSVGVPTLFMYGEKKRTMYHTPDFLEKLDADEKSRALAAARPLAVRAGHGAVRGRDARISGTGVRFPSMWGTLPKAVTRTPGVLREQHRGETRLQRIRQTRPLAQLAASRQFAHAHGTTTTTRQWNEWNVRAQLRRQRLRARPGRLRPPTTT